MDKLTKQQEDIICELLHFCHQEEIAQYILQTIGEHNWTRGILSSSAEFLTEEQEDLYESLGGGYTQGEVDESVDNALIRAEIKDKLIEQGVSKFLYENEEYLDAISEGEIICEGIDIDDIKNTVYLMD